MEEAEAAARRLGLSVIILPVESDSDLRNAFPAIVGKKAAGVVIGNGPRLNAREKQTAALATRYALPTIADNPEYAAAGGLVGYGANSCGRVSAGRRLCRQNPKGEKPGELPVQQADKFDLVINLRTAKALGIAVPPSVLVRADKVIE